MAETAGTSPAPAQALALPLINGRALGKSLHLFGLLFYFLENGKLKETVCPLVAGTILRNAVLPQREAGFLRTLALPLTDTSAPTGLGITHPFIPQRGFVLSCELGLALEPGSAQALPCAGGDGQDNLSRLSPGRAAEEAAAREGLSARTACGKQGGERAGGQDQPVQSLEEPGSGGTRRQKGVVGTGAPESLCSAQKGRPVPLLPAVPRRNPGSMQIGFLIFPTEVGKQMNKKNI